ncbi:MAG TPA: MFS transporter [Chloroflexota bacterium]|nr:MFS transporter [Chloroflexota bacterium]
MLRLWHRSETADADPGSAIGHPFASLAEPSYRDFWLSILGSFSAMQMNIVARGYLAFVLTNSATALGVVSLARAVPMLVLAPYAGNVADRVDKRRLLIVTQVGLMLVALTTSLLVHFGLIQFWHLCVLGFLEGTIFTFNMPTRQSILPRLVPSERLGNAIALNATGRNLTRIVAPSLAGVLIGLPAFGISGAFDFVAGAYCAAALLLLRLGLRAEDAKDAQNTTRARRGSGFSGLGDGFRYILANSNLRLLIILGFVPVLLGTPYQTLLPVFQARVLNVDATGLGIMYGAAGVGGLIGSIVVAAIATHPKKASLQLIFGIMFGVGLLAFSAVHLFGVDLVFLAVVGLFGDGYSTLNSTMVMLNTDRAWYGRVMSIYMMNFALMPLATLPLGALSDWISAPIAVGGAAILIVVLVGGVGLFYPPYRRVGEAVAM